MALRKRKPVTPSSRFTELDDFQGVTKKAPEKSLLRPLKKTGGRNHHGRITSRRRGGGHKRRYRIIDFKRDKDGARGTVAAIEYDPNRSARIALIHYADGEKRYILCPQGLQVGHVVESGEKVEPRVGNAMPLRNIPASLPVHNVELHPGRGGQFARSAGMEATITAKEGQLCHLIMPSGEVRMVPLACRATIGQVGNVEHIAQSLGKAGRSRWLGRRPRVRGVAQNPVAHPMGGGEGRTAGGRHPCSPWGRPAKGGKTRKRRSPSNRMVIRRRTKKRKRK